MRRENSIIGSGRTTHVFLCCERSAKFLQVSSHFHHISTVIPVMATCISARCQVTMVLLKSRVFELIHEWCVLLQN